jgi:HK97 family phage portal protein
MEQPWIAAATMWLLKRACRVPLKVYQRGTGDDDGGNDEALEPGDHPLADAIAKPWDRGSTIDLVMAMLGPVLVHGNSVIEVDDTTPGQVAFLPHDWRFTRPIMPNRTTIYGFIFDADILNQRKDVSVEKILHTRWWSPAGPIGTSPLQQLGVTLQIEDAAQRYQRAIFAHGARPPSAIVASDSFLGIDPAQKRAIMAQLRQDIMEIYSGPENAGRPALLPPGLDWKPIGHSSVEVELIDQRKITREEVCAVYDLPLLPLLGLDVKGTAASVQILRDMIYTEAVGPPLVLLENAFNSQVVRDLMKWDDVYVQFDFSAVLRGDRLAEIDAIRQAIASALMTPNEGRDVLDLPSSDKDGMDDFYLPFNNLQPVGDEGTPLPNITPTTHIPPGEPTPGGGAPTPAPATVPAALEVVSYGFHRNGNGSHELEPELEPGE